MNNLFKSPFFRGLSSVRVTNEIRGQNLNNIFPDLNNEVHQGKECVHRIYKGKLQDDQDLLIDAIPLEFYTSAKELATDFGPIDDYAKEREEDLGPLDDDKSFFMRRFDGQIITRGKEVFENGPGESSSLVLTSSRPQVSGLCCCTTRKRQVIRHSRYLDSHDYRGDRLSEWPYFVDSEKIIGEVIQEKHCCFLPTYRIYQGGTKYCRNTYPKILKKWKKDELIVQEIREPELVFLIRFLKYKIRPRGSFLSRILSCNGPTTYDIFRVHNDEFPPEPVEDEVLIGSMTQNEISFPEDLDDDGKTLLMGCHIFIFNTKETPRVEGNNTNRNEAQRNSSHIESENNSSDIFIDTGNTESMRLISDLTQRRGYQAVSSSSPNVSPISTSPKAD